MHFARQWNTTKTGVRQDSVYPPYYLVYLPYELLTSLSESGQGCHIKFNPFNVSMFADYLLIVSSSIRSLQVLVDKCITKLKAMDMIFNVGKSSCIRVGPGAIYHSYKSCRPFQRLRIII